MGHFWMQPKPGRPRMLRLPKQLAVQNDGSQQALTCSALHFPIPLNLEPEAKVSPEKKSS